jgi:hypothetical protein
MIVCVLVSSLNTNVVHANLEVPYRVLSCIKTSFEVHTMMPVGVKGVWMYNEAHSETSVAQKNGRQKKIHSPICAETVKNRTSHK